MIEIKAQKRDLKERNKEIRKEGFIPAILYGPGIKNIPLKLKIEDFKKVYKEAGETTLISLILDNGEKYLALIHDFQRDPLTEEFIHVDFFQPSLKEKVEAEVPLKFVGESYAEKNLGGVIIKEISELDVRSLPQDLPREIEVDISKLKEIGDEIKVKDLKIPEGVEVLRDEEDIIALVEVPEEEEMKEEKEEEEIKEEVKSPKEEISQKEEAKEEK